MTNTISNWGFNTLKLTSEKRENVHSIFGLRSAKQFMFFHWIIQNLVTMLTAHIHLNLKSRILQEQKGLLRTLDNLEIDSKGELRTKLYDKRVGFDFPTINRSFMSSNT